MTEPGLYGTVRGLFRQWTGIILARSSAPLVEEQLRERIGALSIDPDEYFNRVDGPGWDEERQQLIDSMVVGTTWFLREQAALETLAQALRERGKRSVRVWSAGCSTGQEPYSLLMVLLDADLDPEVIATDISGRALARAKRAEYTAKEVRYVPAWWRKRFLEEGPDGGYRVCRDLRMRVTFRSQNLAETELFPDLVPSVDAVVCRNVLIYFDRNLAVQVVDGFAQVCPTGYVLLGAVEQPLVWMTKRLTPDARFGESLLTVHKDGVERTNPLGSAPAANKTPPAPIPAAPAKATPPPLPSEAQQRRARQARRARPVQHPTPAPISASGVLKELRRIGELRRRGEAQMAQRGLEALCARAPLSAEAQLARGLSLKSLGRTSEAVQAFRNSRFLTSTEDAWMAPYQLGLCLELEGDLPAAREAFRDALRVLEAGGPSGLPESDEDHAHIALAATVAETCRARLAAL